MTCTGTSPNAILAMPSVPMKRMPSGRRPTALTESQRHKALATRSKQLHAAMLEYLVKPSGMETSDDYSTEHGYVWLFQRK